MSFMEWGVRALLGVLVGCGSMGSHAAQSLPFKLNDETLDVSIVRPLPTAISTGMAAFFVDLKNDGARERDVELVYRPTSGSDIRFQISSRVRVPAGTKLRHELLLPSFVSLDGGEFEVTSDGDQKTVSSLSTGQDNLYGSVMPVLILGEGAASTAELAHWQDGLARGEISRGSSADLDLMLSYVGPAELPRRFESYSGLAALLVDTHYSPSASELEPALRWVRLGGSLIFSGPDAERRARGIPGLEPWMQARFRYVNAFQLAETGSLAVYHCGLGQLAIAESDSFLADDQLAELQQVIYNNRGFMPTNDDWRRHYWTAVARASTRAGGSAAVLPSGPQPSFIELRSLEGVGELPYRLFIALLIGFFVLMAPLNFRLVKRTGRPAWLLFTIPLLALLASGAFLSYGILYQGLGLIQASETLTVLDQREHRADTVSLRTFFAGIAPRDGLAPEAGSLVIPVTEQSWRSPSTYYSLEMGSSLTLRGDYLPVRVETTQLVLNERAARGRLGFTIKNDHFEVSNGLGTGLHKLALRAPGGELFVFDGAGSALIEAGASRELLSAGALQPLLVDWMPQPRDGRDLGWAEDLPEGMYLAILESNPFADTTGLVPDEESGVHALFGILSMDPEEWR